jgi:hypothetical protein
MRRGPAREAPSLDREVLPSDDPYPDARQRGRGAGVSYPLYPQSAGASAWHSARARNRPRDSSAAAGGQESESRYRFAPDPGRRSGSPVRALRLIRGLPPRRR